MIKAMNKYAFLIYHREYEEFLRLLQSLGVVHITRKRKPQDENEILKEVSYFVIITRLNLYFHKKRFH